MDEGILYVREVEKRKEKQNAKKGLPTIKRIDIMEAILSSDLDRVTRLRLSNLYAEMVDLKYMSEIAVPSEDNLELYNILKVFLGESNTSALYYST